ncbi:MAG: DUF1540 domain-containing protein [Myxococcota bacterium]
MLVTIDMPAVEKCEVHDCAYNGSGKCHARGITIGDLKHAGCDTFLPAGPHTHETRRMAGVGACKVVGCRFNDDLECAAESIHVGRSGNAILCQTFEKG